ncbi:hypothetical protein [Frankia sp. R82]|uniref:hypothetical protein n=1 Tax=Frankia sp. R82 TaxID=2950553 RepID=UPI002044450B|nr:hypothetical protein [Frankia sp. R82]MCM3883397.1 hypothetical protein [Frankia sp. R82]
MASGSCMCASSVPSGRPVGLQAGAQPPPLWVDPDRHRLSAGAIGQRRYLPLVLSNSGELAGMAAAVFRDRCQGLGSIKPVDFLRAPDCHALGLLKGALSLLHTGGDNRELLGFLLFDTRYARDQNQLDRDHAAVATWES